LEFENTFQQAMQIARGESWIHRCLWAALALHLHRVLLAKGVNMSEADQANWAAILQALTGGRYSESIKWIFFNVLLLGANEIVKIVLSKYELTNASSEAELSDRIVY
jgi:hypothetical protein